MFFNLKIINVFYAIPNQSQQNVIADRWPISHDQGLLMIYVMIYSSQTADSSSDEGGAVEAADRNHNEGPERDGYEWTGYEWTEKNIEATEHVDDESSAAAVPEESPDGPCAFPLFAVDAHLLVSRIPTTAAQSASTYLISLLQFRDRRIKSAKESSTPLPRTARYSLLALPSSSRSVVCLPC